MTDIIKYGAEQTGYILLKRGFRDWFKYMFRIITGKYFIEENLHTKLFNEFENIYNLKDLRVSLNMPPRSGKTTLASYFVAYSIAVNPKCNIIYTSYSQELLTTISSSIAVILNNPVYKAMYEGLNTSINTIELEPIDEFWKDYLKQTTGKEYFSSRKIITRQGGVILFASMGSTITGFGAGIMGSKTYSGCLVIDDGNKPAEIRSETMRNKVHTYFTETLLTRLNNPKVPIVNIQQRLHIDDISGFLISNYDFKALKLPLIVDGKCSLPNQYDEKRLKELQKDNYSFTSQYQQEPILEGGNLIKTEWFNRYIQIPDRFDRMYIVCDTAFSAKKSADNSVFMLVGIKGVNLYILDVYCKKVIFPDLKRDLKNFYYRNKEIYITSNINTIYIENKGSGISLIQELRVEGLPITEIYPTTSNSYSKKEQVADKYTRFLEISSDLESGYCYIPSLNNHWIDNFLKECESFTGEDNTGSHDDQVDCLIYAMKIRRKNLKPDWKGVIDVLRSY